MHHNVFEGNTYRYLLTEYGVAKFLTTKKSNEVAFVFEAIHKKKGGAFKFSKLIMVLSLKAK